MDKNDFVCFFLLSIKLEKPNGTMKILQLVICTDLITRVQGCAASHVSCVSNHLQDNHCVHLSL